MPLLRPLSHRLFHLSSQDRYGLPGRSQSNWNVTPPVGHPLARALDKAAAEWIADGKGCNESGELKRNQHVRRAQRPYSLRRAAAANGTATTRSARPQDLEAVQEVVKTASGCTRPAKSELCPPNRGECPTSAGTGTFTCWEAGPITCDSRSLRLLHQVVEGPG